MEEAKPRRKRRLSSGPEDHKISGIRRIKHQSSERFFPGDLLYSTRHRGNVRIMPRASGSNPPISTSYSCLLIPMCLAAWWFWTKRKARRLVRRLMNAPPSEDELGEPYSPTNNDDFSTWEEVMENESRDPSLHFVRWIKASDASGGSARRRAKIKRTSLRILSSIDSNDALYEIFPDEPRSSKQCWQCLEYAHGIELCYIDSPPSYEDLEEFDGQSRPYVTTGTFHHSELLCTP